MDMGRSRFPRCTKRVRDASDHELVELGSLGISFLALAVAMAASASGTARKEKEADLVDYGRAVLDRGLPANDEHRRNSAVELAAYHGLTNILTLLLDSGCPLKKPVYKKHAIHAALRNGQHAALELILSKRTSEARQLILDEGSVETRSGLYLSSIMETIRKGDVVGAQLLLSYGCASLSDLDAKCIFLDQRRVQKLEKLLRALYPAMTNVLHWRGKLHWSFPRTDRETLNWLWHAVTRSPNAEMLPTEMWLRVFSFCGRGWFASRRYGSIGAPGGEVRQRNIINDTCNWPDYSPLAGPVSKGKW